MQTRHTGEMAVVGWCLAAAACAPSPMPATGVTPMVTDDVRPSAAGAVAPNVRLRTHDDEPVGLDDFRGRVLLVNFIFTRCPLPQICPRLMRIFDDFRGTLRSHPDIEDRVQLLSVTIDPAFDTPDVLRAYGEAFASGRDGLRRWTLATGEADDIRRLADFVGLVVEPASGTIVHSTDIAIIGADGRLVKRFRDMNWDADEAMRIVAREAAWAAKAPAHR